MREKKAYEVFVIGWCTVYVTDCEDAEQAMEVARDEISTGDFEIDEIQIKGELKSPEEIERSKRHANLSC